MSKNDTPVAADVASITSTSSPSTKENLLLHEKVAKISLQLARWPKKQRKSTSQSGAHKSHEAYIGDTKNLHEDGRKSVSDDHKRVNFSPLVEEIHLLDGPIHTSTDSPRMKAMDKATSAGKDPHHIVLQRRASFNDTIGRDRRAISPHKGRRRSISFAQGGIRLDWREAPGKSRPPSPHGKSRASVLHGKGLPVMPKVARHQAIAARHARVLEKVLVTSSASELVQLKAKREKKTKGMKMDRSKIQMYPVVAPRKVNALKQALLQSDMANGIIGELRCMEVDPVLVMDTAGLTSLAFEEDVSHQTEAQTALEGVVKHTLQSPKATPAKVKPTPIRVVCLDCTEEEAALREVEGDTTKQPKLCTLYSRPVIPTSKSKSTASSVGTQTQHVTDMRSSEASAENKSDLSNEFTAKSIQEESKSLSSADNEGLLSRVELPSSGTFAYLGYLFGYKAGSNGNSPQTQSSGNAAQAVQYAEEIVDDLRKHDGQEVCADTVRLATVGLQVSQPVVGQIASSIEESILPPNKTLGENKDQAKVPMSNSHATQSNVRSTSTSTSAFLAPPVSLISIPSSAAAGLAARQSGVFDTLAAVSAAAVEKANGGQEAMLNVKPPTDRMAVFIHWWGFELTLPAPSMKYLGTAHSVSGAFLTFLQSMMTTGGVPELLPFVRYISTFVDMEFSAIKSQDRGQGVVLAATWLMPMALVPRPWDYGTDEESTSLHSKAPLSLSPRPPQRRSSAGIPQSPSVQE